MGTLNSHCGVGGVPGWLKRGKAESGVQKWHCSRLSFQRRCQLSAFLTYLILHSLPLRVLFMNLRNVSWAPLPTQVLDRPRAAQGWVSLEANEVLPVSLPCTPGFPSQHHCL